METQPRQVGGQPPRWIEKIIERLIPGERRIHMAGDLRERYRSISQYLADAAVMIAFAAVCGLRRSLRTSPVFEPRWMGLLITAIGYSMLLFKMLAGPDLISGFDFPFALLTGCALAFFLRNTSERPPDRRIPRPLWLVGLFLALLALEAGLFVFIAMTSPGPGSRPGGWAIFITVLAMSVVIVHRVFLALNKKG